MEKGGGRPKADVWEHVTVLEGKRKVKCNYCGLEFAKSANRIKSHIDHIKGNGIQLCPDFPQSNNLLHSQGLSISDRPRDHNKLNETELDCYMSPKTMWEGIMALKKVQIHKEAKRHQERTQVGPFLVSSVVNDRDLQLIQYVFEHSGKTDKVFSSSRSFLNQAEFARLRPKSLLDSAVIDIFAEILTDIERKKKTMHLNWYLPVTFSNVALHRDVSSFLDFVEGQKIKENYMSDLKYCEKIFIPIHVGPNSAGHFYLYVFHLKNQEIEIWDSLSDQFISEVEREEKTQKLLVAMEELFKNVVFTNFRKKTANKISLQPNGYDCGIFVINFMRQSDKDNYSKKQFDSEEERLDLALMLLQSDLNQEKETLYDKAAGRHSAQEENEDLNLSGSKKKRSDTSKKFTEDGGRGTDLEYDDFDRSVRRRVEEGCSKDYMLPTTDLVGEEFQSHTQQIWKWIMEDEVSAIGIWGMGGVGKTALATHMHNKLLEEAGADFDHVIWVTASQHGSISQLQKVIAISINLDVSGEFEVKRIAGKLLQAFKHMNKCVLILDDVWDHIFLEEVGFPISNNQMKLILTTRLWEVSQGMDCKENVIKVNPLDDEASLALFKNTLRYPGLLSPMVEKIARSMTNECGGLPLAIVTIARSMKGKEDIREWWHMLECLGNMDNGQYDLDKWVFPVLRSSYAHLNDKLQRCFLYRALSINFDIDINYRTKLLVYEELINKKSWKPHDNESYTILLEKLKNNSVLENTEEEAWKMHELLRIMAIGIVEDTSKMMVKPFRNLTDIPHDDKWKEDLQEVFLSGNDILEIPDGTSPRCSQLSTLLLDGNEDLICISDDFFSNMPSLKILDLSNTAIERLPKSVSNLKCLIALLLSKCAGLSHVPSLAKLQRLISLDLSYTAITRAPSGLKSLVNLRFLNLRATTRLKTSTSSISKLTNLQSLDLGGYETSSIDVRAQDLLGLKKLEVVEANFCDIQEFNTYVHVLNRDRTLLTRYHLSLGDFSYDDNINDEDIKKRVSFREIDLGNMTVSLPDDINQLFMDSSKQLTLGKCLCQVFSFFSTKNPHQIELLDINDSDGLEYLCCSSHTCPFCTSLQLVQRLSLCSLEYLRSMVLSDAPSLHLSTLFDHLSDLSISECHSMETVLRPELLAHLQNLESISIDSCDSMKQIVAEDHLQTILPGSGNPPFRTITFPKLRSVRLEGLPELIFVYRWIMLCPSLQTIYASSCQKLNRPHIEISNGSMLPLEETSTGYRYCQIHESGYRDCCK